MDPGYQLANEEEIYPLDNCAKGEEMKRVYNLNKELRSLENDETTWPIATPVEWIQTHRKLTVLFNNFAVLQNERVKIWVGYQLASKSIRGSLHFVAIVARLTAP